jgi:hypothetical protein
VAQTKNREFKAEYQFDRLAHQKLGLIFQLLVPQSNQCPEPKEAKGDLDDINDSNICEGIFRTSEGGADNRKPDIFSHFVCQG